MIIRWLLALLFVFTALTTPVMASCAEEQAQFQMGCCCDIDMGKCGIGEDCCGSELPEPVASTVHTSITPAMSMDIGKVELVRFGTQVERSPPRAHSAVPIADNKLYLKKRCLLI